MGPKAKFVPMKTKKKNKMKSRPVGPNSMRMVGIQGSGPTPYAGRTTMSTNKRSQVIEEDEYIADVNGSVNFATTGFSINPGQSTVFPWGSRIAQLYERYTFEFLEFYFTSSVSGFATNGQSGVIVLSADYDAADAAPTTKQQVEDTSPHTDPCLPSTSVVALRLDPREMRTSDAKYVRFGAQPANTDIKTYDVGNLFVTTQGCANTSAIGELHVRYRVRLDKPVLEQALVQGGVVHFSSIAATTTNNFAAAALQSGGTPSMTGITLGTNTVVFPPGIPGNYLLSLNVAGATSASAMLWTDTSVTALLLYSSAAVRDAATQVISNAGTTNANPALINHTITVPTSGGTVTLTPSTIVGTGTMDLFIVNLPASVLTVLDAVEQEHENRLERLERMCAQLLMSSQPESNARHALRSEVESKEGDDIPSAEESGDELSRSVHIPKSVLSRFMRKQ